jgi:hypothetical protein
LTARSARILLILVSILLLILARLGIAGWISQWPESHSVAQKVQTVAQFGYGFLALFAVVSIFWQQGTARFIRIFWLITLTIAGGLAPIVWGEAGWAAGIGAGLAALLIGILMLWLLAIGTRGLTRA